MTKGIVLLAFGKRGYGFAAYNLAYSIRAFNNTIPISIAESFDVNMSDSRSQISKLLKIANETQALVSISIFCCSIIGR